LARPLVAVLLFGISFGYMEAAVAIYLRGLYEPIHQRVYPNRSAGDLFPLIPLDRLADEEQRGMQWLATELLREAATLVMLAAVALGIGRTFQQGLGVFLLSFGLWDVFYYVFLKVLIDWPWSLFTWDLLFLLPVPWAGPVLAPLLVALGMIVLGFLLIWRSAQGRPVRLGPTCWVGLAAACAMILASFCWDYAGLLAGRKPESFNWTLFVAGIAVGLLAVATTWRQKQVGLEVGRNSQGIAGALPCAGGET
jgi:hypothetical protein